MAVHENDIELLYSYLDGELPIPECEGLWRRLAVEPELNAELDRLRGEHEVRQSAWSSMEPTDAQVASTAQKIFKSTKRGEMLSLVNRTLQVVSAAAALLLVGFVVGFNHNHAVIPMQGIQNGPAVASQTAAPVKYGIQFRDAHGNLVSLPQQFNSLEEAQRAADEMESTLHSRQDLSNNNVVPAAEQY